MLWDKLRHPGIRLLGLGFWQAWWMISMITGTVIPEECGFTIVGGTTNWVVLLTTIGYLVMIVFSRWISPLNTHKAGYLVAAGATAVGTLALPFILARLDGGIGIALFLLAVTLISIGNAVLLIMWGELWSSLATERVGRHLYYSYSFAFALFFLVYLLPPIAQIIATSLLPVFSTLILASCGDEPRRSVAITPIDHISFPYAGILVSIFLVSVIYGFSQSVLEGYAGAGMLGTVVFRGLILAAMIIVGITIYMTIDPPETEPLTLYKPIIPGMAAGITALLIAPGSMAFIGAGLIIFSIYCLDMLIMLVSTDIAFRTRTPVALTFGIAILISRSGTLSGLFLARTLSGSAFWSDALCDNLLVLGVLLLVFIGTLFFTQDHVKRLYPSPERIPENQRSLTDRCRHISELCGLTQRESEVLVLLASGKTVKGVCEELNIAQGTAKHHVSNIYRKIGVFDRQGLHNVVNQGTVGKDSWESVPSRDA